MKKSLFNRCRAVIDADYSPKHRIITSKEEIEYVSDLMGIDELDGWDLQNLRDMWVLLNDDVDYKDEKAFKRYMSVTAIIDDAKYKR